MKDFIITNIRSIVFVLLAASVLVILWVAAGGKFRDKAKQILLALVVAAEQKYGGGTGKIKFAFVAERLYAMMPSIFQVFFSASTIGGWIEDAVTAMKAYFSANEGMESAALLFPEGEERVRSDDAG